MVRRISRSWRIRPYRESDLRGVAAIHLAKFSSLGIRRAAFRRYAAKSLPGNCLVAVTPSQEILGYVVWRGRRSATLYCSWIAVARSYARQSVARRLMSALRRVALRSGYRRIEIDTRNRFRAALSFYVAIGFDVVGVWRGPDRDLMIKMRWVPVKK